MAGQGTRVGSPVKRGPRDTAVGGPCAVGSAGVVRAPGSATGLIDTAHRRRSVRVCSWNTSGDRSERARRTPRGRHALRRWRGRQAGRRRRSGSSPGTSTDIPCVPGTQSRALDAMPQSRNTKPCAWNTEPSPSAESHGSQAPGAGASLARDGCRAAPATRADGGRRAARLVFQEHKVGRAPSDARIATTGAARRRERREPRSPHALCAWNTRRSARTAAGAGAGPRARAGKRRARRRRRARCPRGARRQCRPR